MKTTLLLLLLATAVATSRAELVFDSYLVSSSRPSFVVSSKEKKSGWITLGHSFDGYTLVDFDPKADVLIVEKEGQRQSLSLRTPRIRASSAEDRKARLKSLSGLELAYELAYDGDKLILSLLKRYHEVLVRIDRGKYQESAREFMKRQIDHAVAQRLVLVLDAK